MIDEPDDFAAPVRAALARLCDLAGCDPGEPSAGAGVAVLRVLLSSRCRGERSDPAYCPVALWLRRAAPAGIEVYVAGPVGAHRRAGVSKAAVGPRAVVLGAARLTEPGSIFVVRDRVMLTLPAAVAAAVGLVDGGQVDPMEDAAEAA